MGKSMGFFKGTEMPALTELALKAIKPVSDGTTISDGGNLIGKVRVRAAGVVVVSFVYRYKRGGKFRDLSCGTWPGVSLRSIRLARDAARALLARDIDPAEQKRVEKMETRAADAARVAAAEQKLARLTVRQLFERWSELELATRKDGGKETRRGFRKDVLNTIGDRYADEIKRADLMMVLDGVKARGRLRLTNRMLAELRQMFSFAVMREMVLTNPAAMIQKKHAGGAEVERDRVLTEDQIKALPAALDAAHLPDSTRHAVWVVLATSVRIGELIKAKLADINLDKGEWRIPALNAKNEDTHLIFLSPFALYHMRALVDMSPSKRWLLPSRDDPDQHMDTDSITSQIRDRQLRFYDRAAHAKRTRRESALVLGDEKWTPHDLRRTAATLMQSLGVLPAVIEATLNHREQNRMARIYQRYDYAKEKARAWHLIGERLEMLSNRDITKGEVHSA
jgi:integrase